MEIWNIVNAKPKSLIDKLKALMGINKIELELTNYAKAVIE